MAFTLLDARSRIRLAARNADDSGLYTDAAVDNALVLALDEWTRIVKPTRTTSTLTLTAASASLPTLPTGFLPEQLLRVYLTLSGQFVRPNIMSISYDALLEKQYENGGDAVGRPQYMAFTSPTAGVVYPTPDNAYSLLLRWWSQPTSWTAGTQGLYAAGTAYQKGDVVSDSGTLYLALQASLGQTPSSSATYWVSQGSGTATAPSAIAMPFPDDHMRAIFAFGAPALLQHTEPAQAYASEAFAAFKEKAESIAARGASAIAGQTSEKDTPHW